MDKKRTVLLFGKSGAGKGTQTSLLSSNMKDGGASVRVLEWSPLIRTFIEGDSYAQKRARALIESGERLPAFLAPSLWLPAFLEHASKDDHLIIDGLPRHLLEMELFDSFMEFYERDNVDVVHLDVSDEVARERLIIRSREEGRADDLSDEAIERRLEWFITDTLPVLDFFSKSPRYRVLVIDGSGSVDDVQAEILRNLS